MRADSSRLLSILVMKRQMKGRLSSFRRGIKNHEVSGLLSYLAGMSRSPPSTSGIRGGLHTFGDTRTFSAHFYTASALRNPFIDRQYENSKLFNA